MWQIISWTLVTLILIKFFNRLSTGKCYSDSVMSGQVVIVTGANSGIGYQTALDLARRGAKVILACRDTKRGKKAAEAIRKKTRNVRVRFEYLDLSSFDSIRSFVDDFKCKEAKLDVLINNAGASGMNKLKTKDGIIRDMQVNHFGPFLLTLLLVPLLKKSAPSRVIIVSSILHKFGTIYSLDRECGYLQLYANSKLCNVLFCNELARRLEGSGVVVNSLHPGQVNTSLYRSTVIEKLRILILFTFFKTPVEGAQTSIYLAGPYAALEQQYIFVPFAVETAGCWGLEAKEFAVDIGRRLRQAGHDPRSGSFLVQKLSLAIQRGNAASIMGTFAPGTIRVSDECDQVTGRYFADCAEAKMSWKAEDRGLASELWSLSEDIVKLTPEEAVH